MKNQLKTIQGINYEHIPLEVRGAGSFADEWRTTGLYCVDKNTKFGKWLASQGFKFEYGDWGWVGIWN